MKGHYRLEYLFSLQQAVKLYDTCSEKIHACDGALEQQLKKFNSKAESPSNESSDTDKLAKKTEVSQSPRL